MEPVALALLPLISAIRHTKQQGQDCNEFLRQLSEQLARSLFRKTIHRTAAGQPVEEDEILNSVLFTLFERVESIRAMSEGEIVNFCKRTVATKTVDYLRRGRRFNERPFVESDSRQSDPRNADDSSDRWADDPKDEETPEQLLARKQQAQQLQHALAYLSQAERDLIIRVELYGERIVDIAAETGLPQARLTQRKIRALRKLKGLLKKT